VRKIQEVIYTSSQKEITEIECDVCGAKNKDENWAEDFGKQTITIENSVGDVYPGGGIGESISYDLCPDCFEGKLEPFLKSFGAGPTVRDWDDSINYLTRIEPGPEEDV